MSKDTHREPGKPRAQRASKKDLPSSASSDAPRKSASPARSAAFEILMRVGADKGHCDELLQGHLLQALTQEDRNLATALVMGVLRWQLALDARVVPLLKHPGQKLAAPVATALRMGVFQLLHMDRIPAHAAISESVELCRAAEQPHATGMVNAVLRKIATAPKGAQPSAGILSASDLASQFAHPLWMVERWAAKYGIGATAKMCEANQTQPAAVLRCVPSDGADATPEEEPTLAPGHLLRSARVGAAANVAMLVAHHPARWIAMDEGSQLVAEIAALGAPAGGRILDCCAAPGGKTLVLAERNPPARIVAADSSQRRLDQMRRRLDVARPEANIVFVRADAGVAAAEPPLDGLFDRILCDVPCSGTGTLARNPEIRHRLRPENLMLFAERQRSILRASLDRLAPDGRLVYATCSLEQEENEDVVAACVGAGFRVVDARETLVGLRGAGILNSAAADMLLDTALRGQFLRTLPGVHPCDGFFAAVIERAAAV